MTKGKVSDPRTFIQETIVAVAQPSLFNREPKQILHTVMWCVNQENAVHRSQRFVPVKGETLMVETGSNYIHFCYYNFIS